MPSFRRCSICDRNWPPASTYEHCPGCHTPTAVMNNKTTVPLSDAEAESLVKHLAFEKYVDAETEEEREARQERHAIDSEVDAVGNHDAFHEVIAGAGFQAWERKRIENLESHLPMAHQKRVM